MKKIALLALLVASVGFVSCSKCVTCTKENADTHKVCEKNYNSNTAYGLAIDAYEAMGYKCK